MIRELPFLCTFCAETCDVQIPLNNLKPHLEFFSRQISKGLKNPRSLKNSTLAPYLGRGLLEASLASILFRVDAFRAVTLVKFQSDANFDHNRPQSVSLDWKTDIIPYLGEDKNLWSPKMKPENVSRALLSPYNDYVLWHPAHSRAKDSLDRSGYILDFPSILASDAENGINSARGELKQLYSFWSKGIHGEFFAMGPHTLDDVTCSEKLKRTVDIILDIAFLSHFTSFAVGSCAPKKATIKYMSSKRALHG